MLVRLSIVLQQLPGVIVGFIFLVSAAATAEIRIPENPDHAWLAPLAYGSLLTALDQVDDHVFTTGIHGHILRAANNSLDSWQQADVPTQVLLNAIHMVDSQHGWAAGHDAVILKTTDGGSSWQKSFEAIDEQRPLLDIWFSDADNGIAIGAYGYFLTTSDGGQTWQDRLVNEEHDYHLNAIDGDGAGNLYIAAESGYVYRSQDAGETWEALDLPYEGSFFDIAVFNDTVIVVGLRGRVFISQDAGENWRPVSTGIETALTAIERLASGHVIIAGHAGVVLLLDKQLKSTSLYRMPKRTALSDIEAIDWLLVLAGEQGVSTLDLCLIFNSKLFGECQ